MNPTDKPADTSTPVMPGGTPPAPTAPAGGAPLTEVPGAPAPGAPASTPGQDAPAQPTPAPEAEDTNAGGNMPPQGGTTPPVTPGV